MLTEIHPKLPMRNKALTRDFYLNQLGFQEFGNTGFEDYLMVQKDRIQIHFFLFEALDPKDNYGQVYVRTDDIDGFYHWLIENRTPIHPNAPLQVKPWGQKEFSILDPDNNLLTFGQSAG
ncbi:MAG: VOC family protein [Haliscomenobacter sp.]|nr:VOC family protein [Haliscomenobacter sp.]MBK8880215.1 VOC family protein [Haliscomenobacter sp.]